MSYALVFLAGVAIDISYVLYVRAAIDRRPVTAAFASVLMAAPALFGYLAIVDNNWLAGAYLAGLGCGTYGAVRWCK